MWWGWSSVPLSTRLIRPSGSREAAKTSSVRTVLSARGFARRTTFCRSGTGRTSPFCRRQSRRAIGARRFRHQPQPAMDDDYDARTEQRGPRGARQE